MPAVEGGGCCDLEQISWNERKLKSKKLKRLMGLKVHHDGFKPSKF